MEKIQPHREAPSDKIVILESQPEVDSVTLARLLAEVRNEETFEPGAYNRMHNRHNR